MSSTNVPAGGGRHESSAKARVIEMLKAGPLERKQIVWRIGKRGSANGALDQLAKAKQIERCPEGWRLVGWRR